MKTIHIGKGRAAGRVGSDFLSAIAGRVGSGRFNASPGRVGSKKSDPYIDNSGSGPRVGSCRVNLFVSNRGSGQHIAGSGPRKVTHGQLCFMIPHAKIIMVFKFQVYHFVKFEVRVL